MKSIFVFSFVMYPPDHDFIFFRVFRFFKIFFINISINPIKTQTNFVYTCKRTVECSYNIGPHVNAVSPALGRQSVLQVYPLMSDYKTPIRGDCFDLNVQDVGICGVKSCI